MNSEVKSIVAGRFSTVSGALKLLALRPTTFIATLRSFILFWCTRFILKTVGVPGVELEENVRVQKLSSLMAEAPEAQIAIGQNTVIYEDCKLEAFGSGKITVGKNSILGGVRAASRSRIQLGERVLASWGIFIQDFDPHPTDIELRRQQVEYMAENFKPHFTASRRKSAVRPEWEFPTKSIVIGNDVWLGANCTILKGVQLGDGCIVAAGSVVPGGFYPAGSIIAGNPAKVIKCIETAIA